MARMDENKTALGIFMAKL